MRKTMKFISLASFFNYDLKTVKYKKLIFTYSLLHFPIGYGFMLLLQSYKKL